jgi:hypothetical protein
MTLGSMRLSLYARNNTAGLIGELFGAGIAPILIGSVFGVVVGFISGAIKQGSFKTAFSWAYCIMCFVFCFFATIGTIG